MIQSHSVFILKAQKPSRDDKIYMNESFFNSVQAQSLKGDDRKDYAEKVAFAFMEALGIQDEDEQR